MLCIEFTQRMQDALDARIAPETDGLLRQHAACCQECRELLALQSTLFENLSFGEPAAVESDTFTAEVVQLVAPKPSRSPVTTVAIGILGTLAASIAFLGLWGQVRDLTGSSHSSTQLPPNSSLLATVPSGSSETDEIDTEQYRMLLQQWFARFSEAHFEQLASVDSLAGGFRPLATTFNAAIHAIRRTIPGSRATPQGPSDIDSAWLPPSPWIG